MKARSSAFGLMLFSAVFLVTLLMGRDCHAWWNYNGWAYENAYGYFQSGSVYYNIRSVKNASYDDFGRLVTFDAYDANGKYLFSEQLHYIGNDVYNARGERIALVVSTGEPVVYYGAQGGPNSDQPGTTITAPEISRIISRTNARFMSNRVNNVMSPSFSVGAPHAQLNYSLDKKQLAQRAGATGLAAGEDGPRWGVWANGSWTKLGNSSTDTRFDGSLAMGMTGADYRISDRLLVGFSVGYEHADLMTQFNDGHQYLSGVTLAPYIGISLLENLTLDLSGGLTFQGGEQYRRLGAVRFDSEYQGVRTMLSSNLTYSTLLDNWRFTGIGGFMYTNDHTNPYSERNVLGLRSHVKPKEAYVGEFSLGGRVGYLLEKCEPYFGATYLYDPWMTGADLDRDEVEGVVGINYYPFTSFLISLELANSFLREYVNTTKVSLNLRYEF